VLLLFFASRIAIISFLYLYTYFYRLAVNKSCSKAEPGRAGAGLAARGCRTTLTDADPRRTEYAESKAGTGICYGQQPSCPHRRIDKGSYGGRVRGDPYKFVQSEVRHITPHSPTDSVYWDSAGVSVHAKDVFVYCLIDKAGRINFARGEGVNDGKNADKLRHNGLPFTTSFNVQGGPKKSKPPPIFQKIALKIANEIRFLRKIKVGIKHYNTIRW